MTVRMIAVTAAASTILSAPAPSARITSRGIVEGIVQHGGRWFLTVSRLARRAP